MKYTKICPYCNANNHSEADTCSNCYQSIQAIIPTMVVDDQKEAYYRKCPLCGEKNYLEFKDQKIKKCRLCGNNKINNVKSEMDEEAKEAPVRPLDREELLKNANAEAKVSKTRVKRLALRSLSDFRVVSIPDREGIIGRYGTIDTSYFSAIDHISGNHLLFYYANGECTIEDLRSTNGTCLNGVRLKPNEKYNIKKGDQIMISTLKFEVIEM